ncbi:MAG TPA: S-layer homology domain-containing protein [Thermoanaerobaculia bacterium]|nr:S-layer homology domain-containing protein [Thermoanaerobaculia bacterium]
MKRVRIFQRGLAVCVATVALFCGATSSLLSVCGPFTDVAADAFCPFVLEIFYLGITTGTTATTYDPGANVTRLQMAAFLSRTVDGALKRGGRRASLNQFSTPQNDTVLGLTTVGDSPQGAKADGADVWVANHSGNSVSRVRESDGKLLETWTGATAAGGVLVAMGNVFVAGDSIPGRLFRIVPNQAAGAVTTVASNLGGGGAGIAFDGSRIWTADISNGSVSIVTPGASIPWTVTLVSSWSAPSGVVYDGANVWVTDFNQGIMQKLDGAGAILATATVGSNPFFPLYDGSNIWVPNNGSNSVSVVRPLTGNVLATLTGNGLNSPQSAAFDGQRVLVTNNGGNSVSLWKAADLTTLGTFATGASTNPYGACSDGVNFWITLPGTNKLARF